MRLRTVRLLRLTIPTDVSDDDPQYQGSFSDPFRVDELAEIVAADWSVPGEVTVTLVRPV